MVRDESSACHGSARRRCKHRDLELSGVDARNASLRDCSRTGRAEHIQFPLRTQRDIGTWKFGRTLLSAIRMVRRGDFDVLHLHSSLAGLARIIPGHRAGIVYTPHCYAFERTDVSPLARVLYKSVERGLLSIRRQCVVAVSGREAELTTELSNSSTSIVVGNVSPTDHGAYLRASSPRTAEASAERSRVVMVGRIFPQRIPNCSPILQQGCRAGSSSCG
ncbi:glycosyltransferase [Rhodococcus sp. 3Y1]